MPEGSGASFGGDTKPQGATFEYQAPADSYNFLAILHPTRVVILRYGNLRAIYLRTGAVIFGKWGDGLL